MAVRIPLFPLGTVLFPHMPLSLRIFEERYRAMMRDIDTDGSTFGVIAIREGVEAFGPAIPHRVGTLAHLRQVERRPDGGYDLLVVGASRFVVQSTRTDRPYLVGDVEYLSDEPGPHDVLDRLAPRVARAFGEYARRLSILARRQDHLPDLPDDPELLGYLVSAALRVERTRKQELLEAPNAAERLAACLQLLRRELTLLDRMLARKDNGALLVSPN